MKIPELKLLRPRTKVSRVSAEFLFFKYYFLIYVSAERGEPASLGDSGGQGGAGAGGPHDGRGADPHHPRGRHH